MDGVLPQSMSPTGFALPFAPWAQSCEGVFVENSICARQLRTVVMSAAKYGLRMHLKLLITV